MDLNHWSMGLSRRPERDADMSPSGFPGYPTPLRVCPGNPGLCIKGWAQGARSFCLDAQAAVFEVDKKFPALVKLQLVDCMVDARDGNAEFRGSGR